MRSVIVVMTDVLAHQSFQMPFVQNDDVVEQIASTVANPTLRNTILPGTAEAGPFGLHGRFPYRRTCGGAPADSTMNAK
jgi:hypothetical protein